MIDMHSLCYIVIISYWLRAQMRLFGIVQLFGLKAPEMQLQWRCNCWAGELEAGWSGAWWACCTKSTKLKGFESRAVRPLLNHARSSGSLCAFHTTFGDHCALLKRVFGGDCPFKHQNLREVTAQKCQNCCNFCWKVCSSIVYFQIFLCWLLSYSVITSSLPEDPSQSWRFPLKQRDVVTSRPIKAHLVRLKYIYVVLHSFFWELSLKVF